MRTLTAFAEHDARARKLLTELIDQKGDHLAYRDRMREIGERLAGGVLRLLDVGQTRDICVICTVEDADFLARGVIEELERHGLSEKIHLTCMWNGKIKKHGLSISPVLKVYEEEFDHSDVVFIIVKSIISGACVVKTNLTHAISSVEPKKVFVAAPVMLEGAEKRLAQEFPASISDRFEYVHFATDDSRSEDGEEVIPGIGGSVYQLLGLGDSTAKNKYMPEIVSHRRAKAFPGLT